MAAMKYLLKLAVGAAIAGALVSVIMKQRKSRPGEFFPTELVADTSSVGEGSGDQRVLLPDDGRIGQSKLNS
jgi:hypothetical protein